MGLICERLFNKNNFVGIYSELFTTNGSKWHVNNIMVNLIKHTISAHKHTPALHILLTVSLQREPILTPGSQTSVEKENVVSFPNANLPVTQASLWSFMCQCYSTPLKAKKQTSFNKRSTFWDYFDWAQNNVWTTVSRSVAIFKSCLGNTNQIPCKKCLWTITLKMFH